MMMMMMTEKCKLMHFVGKVATICAFLRTGARCAVLFHHGTQAEMRSIRIINFRPGFYRAMLVDRSPMLGVNEHMGLKLFGREIIFEEFQRI